MAFNSVRILGDGARARAIHLGGGWGIVYDLPGRPWAFGLAGTGIRVQKSDIDGWPIVRRWSDQSAIGYGPVGGVGPDYMGYLRVRGQACLYKLWSRVGERGVRLLIPHLRRVRWWVGP
jgi:hypothetical protein